MIKKLFDKTFLKFILVGVANTVFGTAIMFIMYNVFGVNYWISSASNYVCGSILSYFLNKYFTFKNQDKGIGVIIKFIINISLCYTDCVRSCKASCKIYSFRYGYKNSG